MAERDIAAEVLQGLREVKEYRAGTRTLRTTRVEAKPLPAEPLPPGGSAVGECGPSSSRDGVCSDG